MNDTVGLRKICTTPFTTGRKEGSMMLGRMEISFEDPLYD